VRPANIAWAAIAFDVGCAAPWLAPCATAPEGGGITDMLVHCEAWLAAAAASGDVPALLVAALAAATKMGAGAGAGEISDIFARARAAAASGL
jgi:hypothetical protein